MKEKSFSSTMTLFEKKTMKIHETLKGSGMINGYT